MTHSNPLDRFRLDGRVAIVTGGSRGIGKAIADGFAAAGAEVVVASRSADSCEAAAAEIRAAGGVAHAVPTHMGDLEQISHLVERSRQLAGGIDIIVNNAATALGQPIDELTPEAWSKSLDVNLRGPVFLVKAALDDLVASGHGSVINVMSGSAYLFSPTQLLYATSKAGLGAATRSLAAELTERGVRVNALVPGSVDTDMTRAVGPELYDIIAGASLMRRAADPSEMVGAALLLASDAGSFICGQTLMVDGGQTPRA